MVNMKISEECERANPKSFIIAMINDLILLAMDATRHHYCVISPRATDAILM
jgi:hypothetical protein